MAKRKGKRAPEPVVSQEPYTWEDYGDGSGHMTTDMGHELFSYDTATNEVRSGFDNSWRFMNHDDDEKSWKELCEETYMEDIRPHEIKAAKMAEHGIYYPTYPTVAGDRTACNEVFITDGVLLPMSEFESISDRMHQAEYDNMSDHRISDMDIAGKIYHGLQTPDERGIGCKFDFEGKSFTIQADTMIQVPLDAKILESYGLPVPDDLHHDNDTDFEL